MLSFETSRSSTNVVTSTKDGKVPLRPEPSVVSKDELMSYLLDDIWPMLGSLETDGFQNLIWDHPDTFSDNGMTKLRQAEALDGCSESAGYSTKDFWEWDGYGCPMMPEEAWKKLGPIGSDTRNKAIAKLNKADQAKELRRSAWEDQQLGLWIRASMRARNIKTAPVAKEEDFMIHLAGKAPSLRGRLDHLVDYVAGSYWVAGEDWRLAQGLDLDIQQALRDYKDLTGKDPSFKGQSVVTGKDSDKSAWDWANLILSAVKWTVVGVGVYYVGSAVSKMVPSRSAKAPEPAAALEPAKASP